MSDNNLTEKIIIYKHAPFSTFDTVSILLMVFIAMLLAILVTYCILRDYKLRKNGITNMTFNSIGSLVNRLIAPESAKNKEIIKVEKELKSEQDTETNEENCIKVIFENGKPSKILLSGEIDCVTLSSLYGLLEK